MTSTMTNTMTTTTPVRIGNCSGFYGDRLSAMREMLEGGPLDVLTGDYLAELTMLILGKDTLRDLADAVETGRIPTLPELRKYDDDKVITSLTAVRGIGRWTVEMLLIFLLDRPDVFPVADVGVRRGLERVLGLSEKASPALMLERSQAWAPYRSVASWYLWRAVDQAG